MLSNASDHMKIRSEVASIVNLYIFSDRYVAKFIR